VVLRLDETQARANLGIIASQLVQLTGRKARLEAERDQERDPDRDRRPKLVRAEDPGEHEGGEREAQRRREERKPIDGTVHVSTVAIDLEASRSCAAPPKG